MNDTKNHGFSVVELIIVLVIIGIIAAVGYVVYDRSNIVEDDGREITTSESGLAFEEGLRLEPKTFGVEPGQPVADVSAVKLDDGSWRLYAFAQEKGIVSATSDDGLNFTPEPGVRLGRGAGMPRVIELNNGQYRMYFIDQGKVSSAVSDDGLNFTKEDGFRVIPPEGVSEITGVSTPVKLADGKWHVYFSELPKPGEGRRDFSVYSAISDDLVNWTNQSGVRFGGGKLVSTAEHPDAVVNNSGDVVLYFFDNADRKLKTAVSTDGLVFREVKSTGLDCNDPDIAKVSNDTYRVYCGDFKPDIGGIVKSFTTQLP